MCIITQGLLIFKITNHYEAPEYTLPYKAKKDSNIFYLVTGIFALSLWVIIPVIFSRSSLATIIFGATMLVMYGLFFVISSWSSVVLYEDHLSYSQYWKIKNIAYNDIADVNIAMLTRFEFNPYFIGFRRTFFFTIKTCNGLVEINMSVLSRADLIIILNVIHQFAPHATMNELAEQMKNGDFPVT